ncbi:MAG: HAD-IIIA family hydrolase [Clostridiales bacterium]|jgi:D-glycero-D-manno-heptose 1,7-bisphosphate phosphatase|nr:HAD-IIIA family hydrolase [Clostridiales bacterium]
MNSAVFLDRDGVINPLVYNPKTHEYESPHYPEDFSVFPWTVKSLKLLKSSGYMVFIVSNQPSAAKGKTTMENLKAIEKLLMDFSEENGGLIDKCYYCYHHPAGVDPEYSKLCRCRKPGTLFLEEAAAQYELNKEYCCLAGDEDTDIECGKRMGFYTIKIYNKHTLLHKRGKEAPDQFALNLYDAAREMIKRRFHAPVGGDHGLL